MHYRNAAALLLTFALVPVAPAQDHPSGREIVRRSLEATRVAGAEMVATITIQDGKKGERIRKIAQASKLYDNGATEKKLIRFLAPADVKGVGFLTFDYRDNADDKWLFLPALRKTRRIVSAENARSFMGTEFSYADMTPPALDDFGYDVVGEEEVGGARCWRIEITPLNEDIADENGYAKKISCIAQTDFVIRKVVYYDLNGELCRELSVKDIKELDAQQHRFRIMRMEMENVQNGRRSILQVESIRYAPDINDEYFTVRYLERE